MEWLEGAASGRNGYTSGGAEILLQNITRSRSFALAGIGTEYHITRTTEIYASIAQAYRPIQFANLQAPPTTDVIDNDLKMPKAFNADLGYRGKVKNFLQFDISGYYLQYNNRVGTVTVSGTPSYRLITNVGQQHQQRDWKHMWSSIPWRAFYQKHKSRYHCVWFLFLH